MMAHESIPYELTDDGADYDSADYPVDSTYYECCRGIGRHARGCRAGLSENSAIRRPLDIVEAAETRAHPAPAIAAEAIAIAERTRYVDPAQLRAELLALHPNKAAELLMAFASWFDLDITAAELQLRAEQTAAEHAYRTTQASR